MNSEDGKKVENEPNTKYIIINSSTIHTPPYRADLTHKLMCIEYPGTVQNVEKAIETLGGMSNIETTVGNYGRRLELRFRPDDVYSKPCWGDKDYNCGILVKITVSRPKSNAIESTNPKSNKTDSDTSSTYRYNVVGVTAMNFKFSRLCDFQYASLVPKNSGIFEGPCQNIYKDILPDSLPSIEWFKSDESVSMPLFLIPPLMSKFNKSTENKLFYERYKYYEKVLPEVAERLKRDFQKKKQEPKNVIGHSRLYRKVNSIFVNFNIKDVSVPLKPDENALNNFMKRGLGEDSLEKLKELFEERPIWSKNAIIHKLGVRTDRLKLILPVVAYYFPNGPWRIMWCKFGYDPRTDPTSRIYQTFDFRIRTSGGLKMKVQAKRSYSSNIMHYKAGAANTEKFSLKDCSSQIFPSKTRIDERSYILKPGILPSARQMFYQYCDLQLPEIQEMLNRLPKITKDSKFDIKNGWLPSGFHDQCREIANKYITNHVQYLLLEEKKRKVEEFSKLDQTESLERKDMKPPIVMGTTIIIDDDDQSNDNDQTDDNKNVQQNAEDSDEAGNSNDLSDVDDDFDRRDDDIEDDEPEMDIDLEAVEEINKIIGHIDEPQTLPDASEEEKQESEEEFDSDLINLYKKLIVSNSEPFNE